MPIGLTGWYRFVYQVPPAGAGEFFQFDGVSIVWPFGTAGLSVLRTRVAADFWWWDNGPSPRPGPALGYLPVGVQVAFSEDILGGPPAWLPEVDNPSLDARYRATVNEPATLVQQLVTAYDGSPDLPFQWQTTATVRTETSDSAAQRHFDTGGTIMMWTAVGPINRWVPDVTDSPTFACDVTVAVLVGSHT